MQKKNQDNNKKTSKITEVTEDMKCKGKEITDMRLKMLISAFLILTVHVKGTKKIVYVVSALK